MSWERVSVAMATYNGEKYIREQIDSIIGQTYPIYELIIQDDCSTDRTVDICKEYAARYPFIHCYQNENNLGYNRNFQLVTSRATGDFVAFSDQDDIWFKDKIEKQIDAIGDYDACGSQHMRGNTLSNSHLVDPQTSLEALLFSGFAGHTLLLRRDFIQNDVVWSLPVIYDWGIEVNAQLGHGLVMVDEPLNWHRENEDSARYKESKNHGLKTGGRKERLTPYIQGFFDYRKLQNKANWRNFYSSIYRIAGDNPQHKLARRMCQLLNSSSLLDLFRLCSICLKHGDDIYYKKNQHGLLGKVRTFCYPFIFAYHNYDFD